MIKKILVLTATLLFSFSGFASQIVCDSQGILANDDLNMITTSGNGHICSEPCPYPEVWECYADPHCPKDAEYRMKMTIFSNCQQTKEAFCR